MLMFLFLLFLPTKLCTLSAGPVKTGQDLGLVLIRSGRVTIKCARIHPLLKRHGSPGGCCANKHILTCNTSVFSQKFSCHPKGVAISPFMYSDLVQSDTWDLCLHSPRGHNLLCISVEEPVCSCLLKYTKGGQHLIFGFAFSLTYHLALNL